MPGPGPEGWQTFTPSGPAMQLPEQHSSPDEQSPHWGVHPPAGAHLLVPSPVLTQVREQQSLFDPQMSPTWSVHIPLSLLVHIIMGELHLPRASPTLEQSPEQQSEPLEHVSPITLQP